MRSNEKDGAPWNACATGRHASSRYSGPLRLGLLALLVSGITITGCNGGVPVPGANIPQTCVTQSLVCNPTAALRNYTPAACKTGLPSEYCVAGTGGSAIASVK